MTDDTRPSFFEVYASQHLSSALRPAFKFVFEVLSVRNPRLICLSNWSEEIFSVILFILETSNLRNESSLLAESFYSLRRSQQTSFLTRNINDKPISHRQVLFSLTVSVVIPYFKEKLDSWCSEASGGAAAPLFINQFPGLTNEHENQQVQIPSISQQPTTIVQRLRQLKRIISAYLRSQRFKLLVLKYYPRIRAFCEGINLLFHLLYLHGHSRFFSTSLALQGLILRRLQSSDLVQLAIKNESNNVQAQTSYLKFFSMIMKKLFVVLKGGFFAAIFAFRFLQFYYSAEVRYLFSREQAPVFHSQSFTACFTNLPLHSSCDILCN